MPYAQRIMEEIFPYYLTIGVSEEKFFDSSPRELKPYIYSAKMRRMQKDEDNFYLMHYMCSAVTYAVEHCLAGQKARTQLIKEPILSKLLQEEKLNKMTEEERYDYEVRQAIQKEEMWITAGRLKGLPETIV